jgi:hypothetical protein
MTRPAAREPRVRPTTTLDAAGAGRDSCLWPARFAAVERALFLTSGALTFDVEESLPAAVRRGSGLPADRARPDVRLLLDAGDEAEALAGDPRAVNLAAVVANA